MNFKKINSEEEKSNVCNEILRSLPEWFGIESAIVDYVNDVKNMDTWIAEIDGAVVGFISIRKHNQHSAEIHVMGIKESYHNKQIGTQLTKYAEDCISKEGFTFLTVKTLSESREDENYAKTRKFYLKNGFLPVEEFKTLWGEDNPCLFMIKSLK
jgi:ribosomal protein S18 acetylase RimI-like enzyme